MFLHTHPAMEAALLPDNRHVIVDREDWDTAARPLVLSRRNLLTMLHQLMRPDSSRTFIKPGGRVVKVDTDANVYHDRPAGAMRPETEAFIHAIGPQIIGAAEYARGETPEWAVTAARRIVEQIYNFKDGTTHCLCRACEAETIQTLARQIAEAAYAPPVNLQRLSVDQFRELRDRYPFLFYASRP